MDFTSDFDHLFPFDQPSLFDCFNNAVGDTVLPDLLSSSVADGSPCAPQPTFSDLDPESGSACQYIPKFTSDQPVIPTPSVAKRPKWKKPAVGPPPPIRAVVTAKLAAHDAWWNHVPDDLNIVTGSCATQALTTEERPLPDQSVVPCIFVEELLIACGQVTVLKEGGVSSEFALVKACLHGKTKKEKASKVRRALSAFEYAVHGRVDAVPSVPPPEPAASVDKLNMDELAASLEAEILQTPSYSGKPIRRRARKTALPVANNITQLDTTKYTAEGLEMEENRLTDEDSESDSSDTGEIVPDGACGLFNMAMCCDMAFDEAPAQKLIAQTVQTGASAEELCPLPACNNLLSLPDEEEHLKCAGQMEKPNYITKPVENEVSVLNTPTPVEKPTLQESPEIFDRIHKNISLLNECSGQRVTPHSTARTDSLDDDDASVQFLSVPFVEILPDPEALFRVTSRKITKRTREKSTTKEAIRSPIRKKHIAIIPNSNFARRLGPEVEEQPIALPRAHIPRRRGRPRGTAKRINSGSSTSDSKKIVVNGTPFEWSDDLDSGAEFGDNNAAAGDTVTIPDIPSVAALSRDSSLSEMELMSPQSVTVVEIPSGPSTSGNNYNSPEILARLPKPISPTMYFSCDVISSKNSRPKKGPTHAKKPQGRKI
ncbi:uncharacterized protein LOC129591341 isoform X2 [Paramacrobiotus metropolitanus]|uniref:uncharacterized protein LOC129591341 isoform X2 n=1 Tax=Paramacrobiotus metropolitanus TaxID=2943436 RepID=UPI0024456437|nr:uncharacterized protein LOC129591341 isoform X2 [Paramacrobiotus metropolitanus]